MRPLEAVMGMSETDYRIPPSSVSALTGETFCDCVERLVRELGLTAEQVQKALDLDLFIQPEEG